MEVINILLYMSWIPMILSIVFSVYNKTKESFICCVIVAAMYFIICLIEVDVIALIIDMLCCLLWVKCAHIDYKILKNQS